MEAEKPALGVSRSSSYSDCEVYHVECTCTDPDHAVQAWIELREDPDIDDEVEVTFYVQTNFARWWNWRERFKIALSVLFGRGYEQNHSLLLNKQAALNFNAAMAASINDLTDKHNQSDK
jgi:hypothetical protein